MRTIF